MNNPQQPQMNIDFSQTTAEICEKCAKEKAIVRDKHRRDNDE